MDTLHILLGLATLIPLGAFFFNLTCGNKLREAGKIRVGAYVSTIAIAFSALLSFLSLFIWLGGGENWENLNALLAGEHAHFDAISGEYYVLGEFGDNLKLSIGYYIDSLTVCMFTMVTLIATLIHIYALKYMDDELPAQEHDHSHFPWPWAGKHGHGEHDEHHGDDHHDDHGHDEHGHDEHQEQGHFDEYYVDHEVVMEDGSHLKRRGRYHRFFQALSLFCFSMLGLVLAGNVAMTFVFWELVGICSFFLIGFYVERHSASTAANKAFIVNRVGDFGMIIGLMVIWTGFGTFDFGDTDIDGHKTLGLFSQIERLADDVHASEDAGHADAHAVSPNSEFTAGALTFVAAEDESQEADTADHDESESHEDGEHADGHDEGHTESDNAESHADGHDEGHDDGHGHDHARVQVVVPEGLVIASAREEVNAYMQEHGVDQSVAAKAVQAKQIEEGGIPYGYWLLIIGGIGIFCGCIGKSAQFPLHVWLPDAMEGPTPVSALVHSATMVAAGVFLTGRFFPMFVPEVLLVIAVVGVITLFIAATIAITAVDIKKVLAYSTISQLGYMMMSLGLGGWLAGLLHLFTHAFFKSLLFMGSGSVIHAVHTNDMREMGGLYKKIPGTCWTMFIACLAIAGAGIPFLIGTSGYYSKDAILEQAFSFWRVNGGIASGLFFFLAAAGAAITSFYMFRMWFMTFVGKPRNQERFDHAHEYSKMVWPLVILAVFAVGVAWKSVGFWELPFSLSNMIEASRPVAISHVDQAGVISSMVWPDEHASHAWSIVFPVTLLATATAIIGFLLAAAFYWKRALDVSDVKNNFESIYRLLWNKWWFDELYDTLFVRPAHKIGKFVAAIDKCIFDWLIDRSAVVLRAFSNLWNKYIDQKAVDGVANVVAGWIHSLGRGLSKVQTGNVRQYVLFIAIGALALFLLITVFFSSSIQAQ